MATSIASSERLAALVLDLRPAADRDPVAHRTSASSGSTRSQRSISQPSLRENVASTSSPRIVPLIVAVSGPPKICVQAVSAGVGARSRGGHAGGGAARLAVGRLRAVELQLAGRCAALAVVVDA